MKSQETYILVVGCGRVGKAIVTHLHGTGHPLVVIDKNASALEEIAVGFEGVRITGDATELAVLERGHIRQAGEVIAATSVDTVNLMVTQVARKLYGISNVRARVYHPAMESVYRERGIPSFSPAELAAEIVRGTHTSPEY